MNEYGDYISKKIKLKKTTAPSAFADKLKANIK